MHSILDITVFKIIPAKISRIAYPANDENFIKTTFSNNAGSVWKPIFLGWFGPSIGTSIGI